jgi:hypothetical protein
VSLDIKKIVVNSPNGGEEYGYREWVYASWWQDQSVTKVKVEYSTNGGQSWQYVGTVQNDTATSFRNMHFYDQPECLVRVSNYYDNAEYDISNNYFFLVGLNRIRKDGAENNGDNKILPQAFILHQNYPNPFNPSTTIRYDLPASGQVELIIYDILGREVQKLVSGFQEIGYQQIVWDSQNNQGQSVASGIYLYRLTAGDFVQTKKLILLR